MPLPFATSRLSPRALIATPSSAVQLPPNASYVIGGSDFDKVPDKALMPCRCSGLSGAPELSTPRLQLWKSSAASISSQTTATSNSRLSTEVPAEATDSDRGFAEEVQAQRPESVIEGVGAGVSSLSPSATA